MARNFPGTTSDIINTAETPAVDVTGQFLSLFCWFRPDVAVAGDHTLISKSVYSGSSVQYVYGFDGSGMFLQVGDGSSFDQLSFGSGQIVAGRWHAAVVSKSATTITGMLLFGNRVVRGHVASTRSIANMAHTFVLGTRTDGGGFEFDGQMAHVAIWGAALIEDEQAALVRGTSPLLVRPGSLRGYWPLSDFAGPSGFAPIRDYSRYGTTLTAHNSVPPVPFAAPLIAPVLLTLPIAAEIGIEAPGEQELTVPFLDSTTALYAPYMLPGWPLNAPFIASATALYAPSVSLVLAYTPTIAAATVVYEPTVRRSSVAVGFLASETQVFTPRLVRILANVVPPTISGTAMEGQQLEASDGVWYGTPPFVYAYQWRRCDAGGGACVDIGGATARTYIVQPTDVGGTLRIRVTATDSA